MVRLAWWQWVAVACASAGLIFTGCGDDDPPPPPAACSIEGNTGCGEGLACKADKDGAPACFCVAGANTGCGEGLECQTTEEGRTGCFCSFDAQTGCAVELVCEQVPDGNSGCFAPVKIAGKVFDLETKGPVEGARVVARDVNNAAVSSVAVTDPAGNYELPVPVPRKPDGTLLSQEVLLRADAAGFLPFPKPPRVAIPVDVGQAAGDPLVLSTPATDIGLLALPSTAGLGIIEGRVIAPVPRGTLVVAGGAANGGGGVTGIADADGHYVVFNVPAGSVVVQGYKVGLQFDSETAQVTAGETTPDVDLDSTGEATAVVSGKVEIVNPGAGKDTSVILVVDETFEPNVASGEAPPGLRAGNVAGTWSISGVPDGNYVVLAAFENDFLVRDPDQSIGGTSLVRVTVNGSDVSLSEGFKITGALDVVSPDKEQVVSGTPSFVFADDSSEVRYELVVYDAFGHLVWEKLDVPGVSGSATVTVEYGGPALESGLLYQFRATSIKNNGQPISRTEDLRGVFLYQ